MLISTIFCSGSCSARRLTQVFCSKFVLFFEFYFYRPQRSCGQGYIFTRVCDSVHRGGVCLSACWDTMPREAPPLPQEAHPREAHPLRKHTPPGKHSPPPREADSGIRSMSGRYASYWNAFLFKLFKNKFEGHKCFRRATDNPVLDLWWCLPRIIKNLDRSLYFMLGRLPETDSSDSSLVRHLLSFWQVLPRFLET